MIPASLPSPSLYTPLMKKPSSEPTTRLFLVRHGAATGAEGVAVGQIDLPLSPEGAASIERLAASWTAPPLPDRLISSDLDRTAGTARILARGWGLEVELVPRLREMDFGSWDGLTWKEIYERDGDVLTTWKADWRQQPAPGGECFLDVDERVRAWLDEELPRLRGRTTVVVGHGGSLRILLCHVLGLALDRAFHFYLDHGRVSAIFSGLRGLEVRFMNADRFLQE